MATGPTTRRRQLGAEMKRLRDRSGLTLEEAGTAANVSRATVNRYESATGPVRWLVVKALCEAYGASEDEREIAVELAKSAKIQGWWQSATDSPPEVIKPLLTLEDEATELWYFNSGYVPGLLQTRDYAMAAHRGSEPRASEEALSSGVEMRMKRQEILRRARPPHVWAILDEAVIRRQVGGPAVMADQLNHLLGLIEGPNVTVQVLPFSAGANAAESINFILLKNAQPSLDVVYIPTVASALYLEKQPELDRYRVVIERLRSESLSTTASFALIAKAAKEYADEAG